jgi:peroxiredoxin
MDRMEQNEGAWVDKKLSALNENREWNPDTRKGLEQFRAKMDTPRPKRRRWFVPVAAVAALCAIILAHPAQRAQAMHYTERLADMDDGPLHDAWEQVVFIFHAHMNSLRGDHAQAKSHIAPDFSLTDAAGKTAKLSDFRGKVVLLNFESATCDACRIESPWFAEFQKNYGNRGFIVLDLNIEKPGPKEVAEKYGVNSSLPVTVLIDKSGHVNSTQKGATPKYDFEEKIEALLAK